MWWTSLLKTVRPRNNRQASRPRIRPASVHPTLEALERRDVPSISFHGVSPPLVGQGIAVGDFNHDGVPDLASLGAVSYGQVAVSLGNGDGTFRDPIPSANLPGVVALAVGDFNGDGRLDLAGAGPDDPVVALTYGNGDGTFQAPINHDIGQHPADLAVADFNGDSRPDVATVNTADNSVTILLNDGAGGFLTSTSYPVGTGPVALTVGDFNGDGEPDAATADFGSNTVSILLNNGAGSFNPAVHFITGDQPTALAAGDFNGDGKADLAILDASGGRSMRSNGDGTFQFLSNLNPNYTSPAQLIVRDLNQDGRLDLAYTYTTTYADGYSVVWGDEGSFNTVTYYYFDVYDQTDVDWLEGRGDGYFTYAGSSVLEYGNYVYTAGPFWVPDYFTPPPDYTFHTTSMAAGDFDGNGFPDLTMVESDSYSYVLINDALPSLPRLSINNLSVTEGNSGTTSAIFTVSLSVPSTSPVTVQYATTDGTAIAGSDYEVASGTLNFAPGETSKTIAVSVIGDILDEPDETFSVNLSAPTNAELGNSQGIGTILDDDPPPPTMTINDASVSEGNSGTVNAVFTVSLSAPTTVPVTVNYATANGTATAGSDYQSQSGTLTFAPGEISKTVTVAVNGDRLGEGDERFTVGLTSASNATISDGLGEGTILDDEPRISISDATKKEGRPGHTTQFTFTVTLSAAYDQAVTMSFRTVDGAATTSDNDYVAQSGTLTFAPGERSKTITIVVNGDSKKEADETFYLDLFGNSGNSVFTKNRGVGTILNDD